MDIQFNEEKKFCVLFKKKRKMIAIKNSNEMRSKITAAFQNCPGGFPAIFSLQYLNNEVENFIDLDDDLEMLHSTKTLRVVTSEDEQDDYLDEGFQIATNQLKNQDQEKVQVESSSEYESDDNISNAEEKDEENSYFPHKENVATTSSTTSLSKFLPWPRPFVFKDKMLRPSVLLRLNQKEPAQKSDFSAINAALFDECIKYTYHPADWQYNEMFLAISTRWPHLLNGYPTARDAQWKIRKSIVDCFKNTRKRKCKNVAECIAAKQKFKLRKEKNSKNDQETLERSSSEITNVWGVNNFLPENASGEDERTIQMHLERSKDQWKKLPHNRKESVISLGMEKTFSKRRNDIIVVGKSVVDLLDDYPCLKDPTQLVVEFKRVTDIDLPERWAAYFGKKARVILGIKPPSNSRVDLLMEEIDKISDNTDAGYLLKLAVVLVPSLLREDGCCIFQNFGQKRYPQILCVFDDEVTTFLKAVNCSTFKVTVDGVSICETDDFITSLQVLFATFYIFNICYPKELKAFYTYLQKEVLNLQDTATSMSKVIALIKKVKGTVL